jgi:hypothetical protein
MLNTPIYKKKVSSIFVGVGCRFEILLNGLSLEEGSTNWKIYIMLLTISQCTYSYCNNNILQNIIYIQ